MLGFFAILNSDKLNQHLNYSPSFSKDKIGISPSICGLESPNGETELDEKKSLLEYKNFI